MYGLQIHKYIMWKKLCTISNYVSSATVKVKGNRESQRTCLITQIALVLTVLGCKAQVAP